MNLKRDFRKFFKLIFIFKIPNHMVRPHASLLGHIWLYFKPWNSTTTLSKLAEIWSSGVQIKFCYVQAKFLPWNLFSWGNLQKISIFWLFCLLLANFKMGYKLFRAYLNRDSWNANDDNLAYSNDNGRMAYLWLGLLLIWKLKIYMLKFIAFLYGNKSWKAKSLNLNNNL